MPTTVSDLHDALRHRLRGLDDGATVARWIVEDAVGVRGALWRHAARAVAPEAAAWAVEAAERCAGGEPPQYVLGTAAFASLTLRVTPDVLIPRPETETLYEHALASLHRLAADAPGRRMRVLDAGTGSGALALALKAACPDADVHALDVSPAALAVARANADALGLAVAFHTADLLADVLPDALGHAPGESDGADGAPFDLVVSNPPYVPDAEAPSLDARVRDFEPALALFTGPDALVFYRALARHGARWLRAGGVLWCETHTDLAGASAACFTAPAWAAARVETDAARRPRFVEARRAAA